MRPTPEEKKAAKELSKKEVEKELSKKEREKELSKKEGGKELSKKEGVSGTFTKLLEKKKDPLLTSSKSVSDSTRDTKRKCGVIFLMS